MKYEVINYPDGQISVKLLNLSPPFEIVERINSYTDLIKVVSIADALKYNGIYNYHLTIPCLFGQRSDRRFTEYQSFDLKIIADIINQANFRTVTVFDPHSPIALSLINNCHEMKSTGRVQEAVEEINKDNLILVSPDAGAYKKVAEMGLKFELPVVAAVKYRTLEGEIGLSFMGSVLDKPCLIVDDLCDGGATFLALAEKLRTAGASQVYLYVSHGYFSKGFLELEKVIDRIYCTNSVKDVNNDFVRQFKVF